MAFFYLLAFFGVAALIVAGAILSTNIQQALYNRRLLLEVQRQKARQEMARKLVMVQDKKKR